MVQSHQNYKRFSSADTSNQKYGVMNKYSSKVVELISVDSQVGQ